MSEHFKNKIVKSLSELLPPFADSIFNLLEYVKNNESDYSAEMLFKMAEVINQVRKVSESLSNELDVPVSDENIKDIKIIKDLYQEALEQTLKGLSTLIFLIAKEKNVLEKMKKKNLYEKIFYGIDSPNIDTAVDNLYQGAKKLIKIVDIAIDG